jgi:hypothetical protein
LIAAVANAFGYWRRGSYPAGRAFISRPSAANYFAWEGMI